MKQLLLTTLLMILPLAGFASSAGYPLDHIEPDLGDKASLQRGLQTYMNYCMGCHSLQYQR
ncbi:MAG: ubiquinol-cytochrome c reductase cytochrome c1 subunit, partial [Planctomycetaceae bacterium]